MSAVEQTKGRRASFGWLFGAVWLFYLDDPLNELWHHPSGWRRDAGLAALAGFVALYLVVLLHFRGMIHGKAERERRTVVRVCVATAMLVALMALQMPGAGQHALTCMVYIAAVVMVGLPFRQAVPVAAALVVSTVIATRAVPGWTNDGGYVLAVLLGSLATGATRLAALRQGRLLLAQEEIATLAVANERARIAADLHDILGHSLTVVTVKAELAQRLLDVDLVRARAELRDLETLARDALADVRATALGVRGLSLPGEIAAARSALAAAHVAADLPTAADDVPTRLRELFAWTIREAVTNVVRHSRATRCEVLLDSRSVEILDDGVGAVRAAGGQGLLGLRRRAEAAGAVLTAGAREDRPGFRVRVQAPS